MRELAIQVITAFVGGMIGVVLGKFIRDAWYYYLGDRDDWI